jgi:Ca2+-transporting ATPase
MRCSPPEGLAQADAARRLEEDGRNEIRRELPAPAWRQLARQFNSPLIWLLLAGCAVSASLGQRADAAAIVAIVVLNGAIGFLQERRAEHAIVALRSMTAPRARVRRDGRSSIVAAAEIVRGDVVQLEAGDVVPADARLLEAHELSTAEAALTGESIPVGKSSVPDAPGTPLAGRRNSVFMGTAVASGTGVAEVVAIGMGTELGRIASLLQAAEPAETPLQQRLARVGHVLAAICLAIVAVVAAAGALRGLPPVELLLSSVSLAVAAVPEGLPAIVTIALAVGVQRMSARCVLIRRLPAVETLGCASVICTDKTGTLTTGVMAVRELWGPDERALLDAAAACCDAEIHGDGPGGTGDPTELAILGAAASRGIRREHIERDRPRHHVDPFDAARKWMAIRRGDGILYVKGACEVVLPACDRGTDGAFDANATLAARGLRVLAVATGHGRELRHLSLAGLIGIADPPRPEAIAAIAAARKAGLRVVMITGDHPVTAAAIARELGLAGSGEELAHVVHARATPEDKLTIVREWKRRGAVVAMTGDGVNDAPALREAHIGIAMGRSGTDVTREAADMVLTDDNFASIVAAVREGRGVYDNIRKTLVYLLAGNTSELAVMLAASVVGLPLPFLPLHLLWINIVTDALPALALVTDPPATDALERPPRPSTEPILGGTQWRTILAIGAMEGAVVLGVFAVTLERETLEQARSLAFSSLVFAELFRSFAARSTTETLWRVGALTNVKLLLVVALTVAAQVSLYHLPPAQQLLGLQPLAAGQWALALAAGLCPVTILEVGKMLRPPTLVLPDS